MRTRFKNTYMNDMSGLATVSFDLYTGGWLHNL